MNNTSPFAHALGLRCLLHNVSVGAARTPTRYRAPSPYTPIGASGWRPAPTAPLLHTSNVVIKKKMKK